MSNRTSKNTKPPATHTNKQASQDKSATLDRATLESICKRAHYLATQMIYQANHRENKEKGDPKVGGHISGCASALHIMGALHLVVKSGFDHIANKPHASPTDHAYNYLLNLLLKDNFERLSKAEMSTAMMGLRAFSQSGEHVFQSYHSAYDPDHHNFFPSGTVGIPPVAAGYMALAYRYTAEHGYKVPDAHFWAISGDSEFREGSMYEAVPDFAERQINNLTWIVDYNRQSLDGHRITNEDIMNGTDADRIERTMAANGWQVIQVRHGSLRKALFKKPGGEEFKKFIETDLKDYELQALLLVKDIGALKKGIIKEHSQLKKFLESVSDADLFAALRDFGGHDVIGLAEAMEEAKASKTRPTIIIAHTLKGWGLRCAAQPGNHSALPSEEEMAELAKSHGATVKELFPHFESDTVEGRFLKTRSDEIFNDIQAQNHLKDANKAEFFNIFQEKPIPESMDINFKMASYPHTQWMLGQLTAKLTRLANGEPQNEMEKNLKLPGELFVSMAPDVGTSTNLNPAMDGKIFGVPVVTDADADLGAKEDKTPDLKPGEEVSDRFLRFEIAEGNVMTCVGSFGKIRDVLGVPLIPLMTVYDFFVKRAHDQYFYNLYWKSSFICGGTPSGVTLSPEGAQHGWKSDFQIPNQIIWEPFFCQELDWIFCETLRRHVNHDNGGRSGALLRLVTRGADQKDFLKYLKKQIRFKAEIPAGDDNRTPQLCRAEAPLEGATPEDQIESIDEAEILKVVRNEVLSGAYYLIDYRGYAGYEAGDNVVNIFALGSPATEAILASESLLAKGIYANVIIVTSPDLLCGIQAHESDYEYLRKDLKCNSDLHLFPRGDSSGGRDVGAAKGDVEQRDLLTLAGNRIPIVSVHDGEAGILDNLGSIVGVKQEVCAVRKHSKCGRPSDIYRFHGIDADSIVRAVGRVLSETALEKVLISRKILHGLDQGQSEETPSHWTELWPQLGKANSNYTKH